MSALKHAEARASVACGEIRVRDEEAHEITTDEKRRKLSPPKHSIVCVRTCGLEALHTGSGCRCAAKSDTLEHN